MTYNGPQKEFLEQVLEHEPVIFGRGPAVSVEPRPVWAHELPDGRSVVPPHIENAVVYRVGIAGF